MALPRPRPNLKALGLGIFLLVLVLSAVRGSTAANIVESSRIGTASVPVTIAQLAPPECAGLPLTGMVYGDNGNLAGTQGADFIIGAESVRQIQGRQGDDCIVGWAGVEMIDGQQGVDVCIGPSSATYRNCEVIIHR